MQTLLPAAHRVGELLKARKQTLSVAESSAGGLVSAALLAVPGASAYFMGGAVVYTRAARTELMGIPAAALEGMRPSTEPYALLLARSIREKMSTDWGIGETGATGPTGNRYGDAAGHACIGVAGPVQRTVTVETGHGDREANMRAFALRALEELEAALRAG